MSTPSSRYPIPVPPDAHVGPNYPAPTVGRIVLYKLSDADVDRIVDLRMSGEGHGNTVHKGDVLPAIVVNTFDLTSGPVVNLQVFLDGDHVLWATSRSQGDPSRDDSHEPGSWQWPTR